MRVVSNITCIFAIIAQIFLSSIAFAHDLTCQANSQKLPTEVAEPTAPESHTHRCGCCHHSHDNADDFDREQAEDDPVQQDPFVPNIPCSCSSDTGEDFIIGEYSIETRERKIALFPAPLEYSLAHSYASLLPRSEYADTSLRSLVTERTRVLFLPEYSGTYLSTHLSKFTI